MHLVLVILIGCLIVGLLGSSRRLGFWGAFFSSALMTPLVGLLLVIISGPVEKTDDDPHA